MSNFDNDYVVNKFGEWKNRYDIPDHEDFNLKMLFSLEKQYIDTPEEHIKTKRDILSMINSIKNRMSYKYFDEKTEKTEDIKNKDKKIILVVTEDDDKNLREIFYNMLGKEVINYINVRNNSVINTNKYIIKFKEKNSNNLRGMRCDYFLNLTGDKEFENEVLRPMVRPL